MSASLPGNLPDEMTVIEIREPGGPEVLIPSRRPLPVPKPGEVLLRVRAAGVNRPDVLQRAGNYPPPPGASDIPGLEIAGEIVALGEGVQSLSLGNTVTALVTGGGYAQYCAAPVEQCLPIPAGLDFIAAAALPETFFTVWSNVFDRAGLQPGESLLVHGGSSGIGTTAIQLATALGSRVFATAGSPEKLEACLRLGAERAINYRDDDFVEVVKEATDGKGVNVILDMVGGDYIARDIKALAPDGRLVFIAFLGGPVAEINFQSIMLKRLTVTGSTLRARDVAFKSAIAQALLKRVWPLIEAGRIAPVIHKTFSLEHAAAAHALMESSNHIGKIMLEVA
ncbi:NAD(P)H-quinone oxidoreductase [Limibacillus halophilus]|uniref:Putative PIG3 family NAD(P)H quinone oxidoreductase n=1 Tax=Limibacillus halophilus TaxID=1579333 RepID=A0A839SR71_9PROT|nr:NAD(P)H-quinone oxidoreductase [Limibacillus halophilus]MBB3065301.1 putative PIG3 family NAD(P)H quinone oxidoreductase [Limibacillus halophilus]